MGIADSTFRGAATRYMESLKKKEKCYFCDHKAEYNQVIDLGQHGYSISGVCKSHLEMGLSS
jgi:hypothetical protein